MAEYRNPQSLKADPFTWDPGTRTYSGEGQTGPDFLPWLLNWRSRTPQGTLDEIEQAEWRQQEAAARAIPTRDLSTLHAGWGGENQEDPDWWTSLNPTSPDAAPILLALRDKLDAGTATDQERALYDQTMAMSNDWIGRASKPDPWSPLGDQLFSALTMLSIGASGGAAAAALASGGLSLAGLSGLAGATSGITGLLAEPLDSKALKLAGMATGVAGGVTSLASLLSNGLNSVGDVVKAVQKVYGTGTKAMNLIKAAQQGASNPQILAQAQQKGRQVGTNSQQLSSADQRTDGRASTTQGGGMDFSQLGPALAGIVGMVGQGLSLSDASRYMEQLKTQFGDEQEIKDMIDQAYQLAVRRYEITYARTEEEYKQKQEQYAQQKERYETHYQDTRKEQEQKQAAYAKGEGQIDRDREAQIEHFYHTRERADSSYNQRVAEAAEDRERKINVFGEDRQSAMADYNRRVQEAQQDRQKEYATFDQQMTRHMGREDRREAEVAQDRAKQYGVWDEQYGRYKTDYDRRVAEAAEERGLDKAGYEARHAIGADLRDPAKLAAGAQAVYNPLSAAARERINVQSEEEMARRGVAGGGMYSNLLAAKAFAPQEAQLWQNAMQNYMAGQTGALTAYGNVDLAGSPEYRMQQLPQFSQTGAYNWAQTPNFSKSPEFRYSTVPDMPGTPQYTGTTMQPFTRTLASSVPGAVGTPETPKVPTWTAPGAAPLVPGRDSLPTPYQAYDGGKNSAMTKLVGELTKAMSSGGAGAQVLQSIIKAISGGGGGDAMKAFTAWGGDETQQPWYDPAYVADSPWNWEGQESDYSNWNPWETTTYTPDAGSDVDYW